MCLLLIRVHDILCMRVNAYDYTPRSWVNINVYNGAQFTRKNQFFDNRSAHVRGFFSVRKFDPRVFLFTLIYVYLRIAYFLEKRIPSVVLYFHVSITLLAGKTLINTINTSKQNIKSHSFQHRFSYRSNETAEQQIYILKSGQVLCVARGLIR